jgi:hypothetical protein
MLPNNKCVTKQKEQGEAGSNAESPAVHEQGLQRIPYDCS